MLELRDLTVGQVSGMIAAAVFFVQFLVPMTLPLILLGLMKFRSSTVTQTAVSWSVIGRLLHSSWWPVLLQTDSAQTVAAGGSPLFISLFRAFTVILIGVAAIVTPLGLYEGIIADKEPSTQAFHYIPDKSPMGLGTAPRSNTTWSRICGGWGPYPCPNSNVNITRIMNTTGEYVSGDWYDSRVLSNTIDVLHSGLKTFQSTVSGPFDIQYRMYQQSAIDDDKKGFAIDNGTAYTVGSYMPLSSLVMADDVLVVEGLIVDMKGGGIGFRNHSAPAWRQFGSTWEEDILFIMPDTVCVDTNLTLGFTVPKTSSEESGESSGVYKLTLTDQGGFANLNTTYPSWIPGDTQTDPLLQFRAYKAAWLNNAFAMAFMNVTNFANRTTGQKAFSYLNSTVGKTFPLHYPDGSKGPSISIKANSLYITTSFDGFIYGLDEGVSNISTIGNSTQEYNFTSKPPIYSNPFGLNRENFSDAGLVCQGAGGRDLANITNQMAECGMLYGAPRRADGSDSMLFDPGSEWTVSMYSCMSTVKAVIKRVSFRFNGTDDDLASLKVTSLRDKEYSNEESKPTWAAENTDMKLRDGSPLWGIVDPARAQELNLSTFRSERFYLPGYVGLTTVSFENLPAIDFARYALSETYSSFGSVDYSGATNLAMYRQWRDLSKDPVSAAKILNLIWTDISANLVVGTKSLAPSESQDGNGQSNNKIKKRAEGGGNAQKGPAVTGHERRVRYKLPYGVPAFLALVLIAFTVIPSVFFVFSSARPSQMRQVLNATSAGRLLTAGGGTTTGYDTSYGGQGHMAPRGYAGDASTKDWVQSVGKAPFTLGPEGWSKNMQLAQSGTPYGTYGDGKNGPVANYAPVPGGQY